MARGAMLYAGMALAALLLAMLWRGAGFSAASPQMFPIRFYQQMVGDLDGRTCPSYPVCSGYARQAFSEYGVLLGSWLALDRLIHEGDDLKTGPWIVFEGQTRLHDPLQRNSFWLHRAGQEE